MIEKQEMSFYQWNHPGNIMHALESMYHNQETYNDSVELLRRLLLFIYEKTDGDNSMLWDIKPKKLKAIKKYLDKVDEIIVGNK